jgi:hypothetical protein
MTLDTVSAMYADARQECLEIFAALQRLGGRWRMISNPPESSPVRSGTRDWAAIEMAGELTWPPTGGNRVWWTYLVEVRSVDGAPSMTLYIYRERSGRRADTILRETVPIPIDDPSRLVGSLVREVGARFFRLVTGQEDAEA